MMPFALRFAVIAAIGGLVAFAAPSARAFTMDTVTNTNPDGSARYVDPDEKFSDSDKSKTTIKQGNTTFQFGGQPSFNQQYNSDRMFDPASRLDNAR